MSDFDAPSADPLTSAIEAALAFDDGPSADEVTSVYQGELAKALGHAEVPGGGAPESLLDAPDDLSYVVDHARQRLGIESPDQFRIWVHGVIGDAKSVGIELRGLRGFANYLRRGRV